MITVVGTTEEALAAFVHRTVHGANAVEVHNLVPIAGGFSRETFRFDAHVTTSEGRHVLPMILRKDPPAAASILQTSRKVEHDLIEALRVHTSLPVSRSYGYEMDASVFGECAMVIQRMHGSGQTSNLFNGGDDADQVDDVVRHLCEMMAELHSADVDRLNVDGQMSDPRGVGIDTSSWDAYMDSTFEYYISSYPTFAYDPSAQIVLDAALTLRRHKPRPLRLSLVHGDFNPANFLYEDGKVTALIDWENSRVGDPREDLGWMVAMDQMSDTSVMSHPRDEGGFLAYYNKLTGLGVTQDELNYFVLFGTLNIAVPVSAAIQRRVAKEHHQLLHLYMLQPALATLVGFTRVLGYPGVPA